MGRSLLLVDGERPLSFCVPSAFADCVGWVLSRGGCFRKVGCVGSRVVSLLLLVSECR